MGAIDKRQSTGARRSDAELSFGHRSRRIRRGPVVPPASAWIVESAWPREQRVPVVVVIRNVRARRLFVLRRARSSGDNCLVIVEPVVEVQVRDRAVRTAVPFTEACPSCDGFPPREHEVTTPVTP